MLLVSLPPYPDLSFPREMDFCARHGQGRVKGELEQSGEFRPSPAPDLVQCREVLEEGKQQLG